MHLLMFITLLLLVVLSGFFSASETAFSTVNLVRLKSKVKKDDKRVKVALKIAENFDETISAILICNTVLNIISPTLATVLTINLFGQSKTVYSAALMAVFILIFAEVLPKSLAKENSEAFALASAKPLNFIVTLTKPLNFVFLKLKKIMVSFSKNKKTDPSVTEQELKHIVKDIEKEGVLEKQESEMVRSALEFDEKSVGDILTPRIKMIAVDVNEPTDQIQNMIIQERYSRIPVYQGSIDNIVGILHARDYLESVLKNEKIELSKMLRSCYFVYEGKELSTLLADFKHKKTHVAVVLDDYGGTLGMVTMEDLLEEIVGDIWDEDEEIEHKIITLKNNTYEISGDISIKKLFNFLKIREDEEYNDYSTLSGFVVQMFHEIPKIGQVLTIGDYKIIVKEVNEKKVTKFIIKKLINQAQEDKKMKKQKRAQI
ncbi:MAG: hemolysin family protein [Oscillospiraceae bacterium]|nr:hemolysin family protein [Oscillospiraceae bacterium]